MEMVVDILKNTFMVTGFVLIMMLLIEYLHISTQGRWSRAIERSGRSQIVLATLIGLIPGCLGGFAVVSLFTHRIVGVGALVAAMIASVGDEAFLMFALFPGEAFALHLILIPLALIAGYLTHIFSGNKIWPVHKAHPLEIHAEEPDMQISYLQRINLNFRHPSWQRVLIIAFVLLFATGLIAGLFSHTHGASDYLHQNEISHSLAEAEHTPAEAENHAHHSSHATLLDERWLNLLFAGLSLITCVILSTVSEHFIKVHLWAHIIKIHAPRIFFWTLGTLTTIWIIDHTIGFDSWISQNMHWVLVAALVIGWIPQSGPHMVFVTLFASGGIPFSVLLANSTVQSGHAGLPLLAESKSAFMITKIIATLLGLLAGLLGLAFHF